MGDFKNTNDRSGDESQAPESPGRRALLKGASTALPAVLTLQSGAAFARSSNLISASNTPTVDGRGRTLCLKLDSVYPVRGSHTRFDLGEPASADVIALNNRDYRVFPSRYAPRIGEARACQEGRTVYYVSTRESGSDSYFSTSSTVDGQTGDGYHYYYRRRWKRLDVPRGVLVSATALSSFAGSIVVHDL